MAGLFCVGSNASSSEGLERPGDWGSVAQTGDVKLGRGGSRVCLENSRDTAWVEHEHSD